MSEMHAETALWIDGLRKRADKGEDDLKSCPMDHQDTVAAHDRLSTLRSRLDHAERSHEAHKDRADLESMADEVDAAVARAIARM